MHPEMVAAYIAKYATKAAEDFGLAPQRHPPAHRPRQRCRCPTTSAGTLATAVQIGSAAAAVPAPAWAKLTRWLHMLGFRGHFATKSRRYSVTLGRLRAERRTWRQRHTPDRTARPRGPGPRRHHTRRDRRTGSSSDSAGSPPATPPSPPPPPPAPASTETLARDHRTTQHDTDND